MRFDGDPFSCSFSFIEKDNGFMGDKLEGCAESFLVVNNGEALSEAGTVVVFDTSSCLSPAKCSLTLSSRTVPACLLFALLSLSTGEDTSTVISSRLNSLLIFASLTINYWKR